MGDGGEANYPLLWSEVSSTRDTGSGVSLTLRLDSTSSLGSKESGPEEDDVESVILVSFNPWGDTLTERQGGGTREQDGLSCLVDTYRTVFWGRVNPGNTDM